MRRSAGAVPYLIAHRAGNEPAMMSRAVEAGADLVEADVRYNRGRIEVRHMKMLGPLPILWDRWSIGPGWAPRMLLDDLLRATPPGTELMLDIKPGAKSYPQEVLEEVRRGLPGVPYTVCSQDWRTLEPFHGEPGARVVHSIGSRRMLEAVMPHLERHGSDAVSIHSRLLNPASVARLRERVSLIMTWPVNHESTVRRLQAMNVNAFIIDDLELIRRLDSERGKADGTRTE